MSRQQPLTLEEFKSIYSRVPRLCVDLVIQNEEGTLLTLRQDNGYVGQWHLPGGTIYMGEMVQNAIQRVAQEELGVSLEVIKQLGYIEFPSEQKERGYGYTISMVFLCKPMDKEIILDNQVSRYQYFKAIPKNTIIEQREFLSKL